LELPPGFFGGTPRPSKPSIAMQDAMRSNPAVIAVNLSDADEKYSHTILQPIFNMVVNRPFVSISRSPFGLLN
jgi:hypothetical protein